jgi:murein DD-endopeptidase MepM/ murein hydrolase activator NlpD
MRRLVRFLFLSIVFAGLCAGIAFYFAGRQPGPAVEVRSPDRLIGQNGTLDFSIEAPGGRFTEVRATIEQDGHVETVFSIDEAGASSGVQPETADRMRIVQQIGRRALPSLKAGPARIAVSASRPVLFGYRQAVTVVTKDVDVRLDPPRLGVVSLHHFVNHGGAEFVVYRVAPPDARSGVRVGQAEYPGFPGAGAGLVDPGLHVAFFALSYDQDVGTPIQLVARDEAGNEATTPLDHRVFPKAFVKSRIEIDQRFLERVVPAIHGNTPGLDISTSSPDDLLNGFLKINGDLRHQNNSAIAGFASRTRPEILWRGAFAQLGNTAVESRFADYRTYFFRGKEIDRQVHLGFDLASTAQAPVLAAGSGVVVFASFLGIYGNCVVIDHGLGVQSLYAHLSSMAVKDGESVEKGHELGRTGITGLAGGDHLHFTMLVDGTAVNPVEWWDPHWLEDRVYRKIREAGGTVTTQ